MTSGTRSVRRARTRSLVLSAAVSILGATGCISFDPFRGGDAAELVETVVRGDEGPKILLVEIDGIIGDSDGVASLFGTEPYGMLARVRETLDRARQDDSVDALLLRIDSPGGTATVSEQIYTEIVRFRTERDVPVMAQFLSTAASGAYYVAMSADRVQAHPTTITGSIGVIFSSLSFAGLMEKVGVEDQTLTGGTYKDAGSPYRRLTDVERAQLQAIVDDLHARFREIVDRGRPALSAEQIAPLSEGQIYSARQALANGLVDQIGTLEDAVAWLEERLGVEESRVVSYHRPREIRRNLYTRAGGLPELARAAAAAGAGGEARLLSRLERLLSRPGFHYLWWPGLVGMPAGR